MESYGEEQSASDQRHRNKHLIDGTCNKSRQQRAHLEILDQLPLERRQLIDFAVERHSSLSAIIVD